MPGIILFKRRWGIGTDDFVFPSLGELIVRIAWFVALLVIVCIHKGSFNCDYGSNLHSMYIGSLIIDSFCAFNVLAILHTSSKGTIRDGRKRRKIYWFLYFRVALIPIELVWMCVSTYFAFGHHYKCDWSVVWTARGAVITAWAIGLLTLLGFILIFDPAGSPDQRTNITATLSRSSGSGNFMMGDAPTQKIWERRCRFICCCIACNQNHQQAFVDVAKITANLFQDLDLVPTDIAAGLMLVQNTQTDNDRDLRAIVVGDDSRGDPQIPTPKSWMTISNMNHYMKYAMSSYGWPFFVYENICTGACRLFTSCRCCACCRDSNGVFQDNICNCNTAAIKKFTGIDDDCLLYVTFHNQFKEIPFFVAIDKEKNNVVVSIRGTLSLEDALADLSAEGCCLDICGLENSYCHSAMLDCAKYIQSQLKEKRLLETAFDMLPGDTGDKGLVITGHSLGAGVAAILSVLLHDEYPDLMCFSFSPPGGLMSAAASKHTHDFICSVILGKDLVPRLGMSTLLDLKVKILHALYECTTPKYKILASGCLRLLCCSKPEGADPSSDSLNGHRRTRYVEDTVSFLETSLHAAELEAASIVKTEWPLHPAGQILHIVETDDNDSADKTYCAVWSRPDYFNKIVISQKMIGDHFPNAVFHALEQLVQDNATPTRLPPLPTVQC